VIGVSTVVVVAIVCVVVEAFFSGSEIAMVSASRARLRERAAAGDRGARLVEEMLARPQLLLATTLLGTNIAAVSFSVVVAIFLIEASWAHGEAYAILFVTPVTLILGEVVPKTLCQQYADRLVTRIVFPLKGASLVLRPFVLIMGGFATVMTRLLGGDRRRAFVTREELLVLIEQEGGPSEITASERELISNVLESRGLSVADVFVSLSEVTALPSDATLADAAIAVADKGHSRIPIYGERVDDVVGVLYAFDLLRAGPAGRTRPVTELMRPPVFVVEGKPAVELLAELKRAGKQLAVVVDEYGGAIGIVTIEDLIEEIVGEIEDEHDAADPPQVRLERPGVWRAEARTSVARINVELGLDLPESDAYETLAGLVLDRLKRIPTVDEAIRVGPVTIRVVRASRRAVEEVQLLRHRGRKGPTPA
jgi:CBS domain containing-hemolysin-like protein